MLEIKGTKVFFNGSETLIHGRSSFKFMAWLNSHFSGNNGLYKCEDWIEHNQNLGINLLRVFGETGDWDGHPMFGSDPTNGRVWDINALRQGERPTKLTRLNEQMCTKLFELSHTTNMAFEYVVDATLKHTSGVGAGVIGHCIRQTMAKFRQLQTQFPNACILVNFHNEWDAHNKAELSLRELNQQASRARRWVKGTYPHHDVAISFESPGPEWEPEQWPEAAIMVDHGGRNDFEYRCGTQPYDFMMAAIHPRRDKRWWELPDNMNWLRSHGRPIYFSESKLYVDESDANRAMDWYNLNSYTVDLDKYLEFMNSALEAGVHFTIHDEKGMQTDTEWPRPLTRLEDALGGSTPPPPPPPPQPDLEGRVVALEKRVKELEEREECLLRELLGK